MLPHEVATGEVHMVLLESRASIEAALATMHPIAKEAAQLLAHRIEAAPFLMYSPEDLQKECVEACLISLARSGIIPSAEPAQCSQFLANHQHAVLNLAVSIVVYVARDSKRKKMWGWLGKAAAVAAGVAIGAFFG